LRDETAAVLHQTVAAMNVDNFVVRPQRQHVERFARAEAWQKIGPEDVDALLNKVAGLPSAITDDDEDAKRFDMLVLRTQLSVFRANPDFAGLRDKIRAIAAKLEEQGSIPAVRDQMVLIQALSSEEWWQDVTAPMLETVRRRLRALVKLIPKGERRVVYTNFQDELGEVTTIELPQVTAGLDMARFREKARVFLRAHESHISLQRLRRNQPLTAVDLAELERMLVQAGGSQALIQEASHAAEGLGLFIRSLVGLDREAAMQAFGDFVSGTTATSNQIEFINLVVDELTQTGVMAPERLFQSPFTDFNAQGPLGVFPPAKVTQIVEVLQTIRQRAVA
jgi:type I restriction enzyme R subunit